MKRFLSFFLSLIPAVLCMILIFCLSSQTADVSSETSGGVIKSVLSLLPIGFERMTPERQAQLIESCQFVVRKGAHFSIYALLGILCIPPMRILFRQKKSVPFAAWMLSFLYAISDELHQKYVPGRSCELRDVIIDSAGAALGILIVCAIIGAVMKRKQNPKKRCL